MPGRHDGQEASSFRNREAETRVRRDHGLKERREFSHVFNGYVRKIIQLQKGLGQSFEVVESSSESQANDVGDVVPLV